MLCPPACPVCVSGYKEGLPGFTTGKLRQKGDQWPKEIWRTGRKVAVLDSTGKRMLCWGKRQLEQPLP